MIMEVKHASCGYGAEKILENISFEVNSGQILCILGPNGVGKTTLFKSMLGFLKLQAGEILLDGADISKWTRKSFAKSIGYVPQAHVPPFPFKVIEVVLMGRTSHIGTFSTPSKEDKRIARNALETLDILYLENNLITEISGGERQMVLIARALAQKPEMLILDEPTSNLDFGNQVKVLNHINNLAKSNIGVVMTSHFPDHAFLASNKVAIIGKGNSFCIGTPDDVVTKEKLEEVYGVNVRIRLIEDKYYGNRKVCIPVMKYNL